MAKDLCYWDANAFLGYLMEEADKVADCESVLKEAEKGHLLIVTSALTLAEVLFIKGGPALPAERRQKVENFFKAEYIAVRNVTRAVGELARDVYWDHGVKPKDAVHVATAAMYRIPELHTFDGPLIGLSGVSINGHSLTIKKPHLAMQLELQAGHETEETKGSPAS